MVKQVKTFFTFGLVCAVLFTQVPTTDAVSILRRRTWSKPSSSPPLQTVSTDSKPPNAVSATTKDSKPTKTSSKTARTNSAATKTTSTKAKDSKETNVTPNKLPKFKDTEEETGDKVSSQDKIIDSKETNASPNTVTDSDAPNAGLDTAREQLAREAEASTATLPTVADSEEIDSTATNTDLNTKIISETEKLTYDLPKFEDTDWKTGKNFLAQERFPMKKEWTEPFEKSEFKCCLDNDCKVKGDHADCRLYTAPDAITESVWTQSMTGVFGGKVLSEHVPGPDGKKCTEIEAGNRGVSLATLKQIEEATQELMKKAGGQVKIKNRRYFPTGKNMKYEDLTVNEINGLVVLPLAVTSHKSLAEYIGCGKPNYFISYNLSGRFYKFVQSVKSHFAKKRTENVGSQLIDLLLDHILCKHVFLYF